jgi:curved DNA-binding protein CbpA
MNQQTTEFYRELDLEPGADLASVRKSYRQLVKVWHPDRFGNDQSLQSVANDKLTRINFAYEALCDFFEKGGIAQSAPPPKTEPSPKVPKAEPGFDIYHAGLRKYRAKDYKGSLILFLQAAEIGNADAQYGVGFLYYHHRKFVPLFGANKHFADILRWWTKAAEQGHTDAQYMVGTFHQTGFCTPFDEAEARKWFQRAASKGHLRAKERLNKLGVLNKINAVPLVSLFLGDTPPGAPPPR